MPDAEKPQPNGPFLGLKLQLASRRWKASASFLGEPPRRARLARSVLTGADIGIAGGNVKRCGAASSTPTALVFVKRCEDIVFRYYRLTIRHPLLLNIDMQEGPMEKPDKDWLLTLAGVMLIFAELAFVLASVGVVIGVIAMFTFGKAKVLADLAAAGAPDDTYWAIVAVLVLAWAMLSLSMMFIRQLRAIVGTVNQGDPFVPDNAARLARMGWYALGTQLCEFAGQPLIAAYGTYADSFTWGASTSGGQHISLAPLGLAVTLFILARVFRKGAEMREDLEGTV
jgi:hypothetical protein